MEKLVEGEAVPRAGSLNAAPALAVQFFLIPLAVVAVLISIYAGFRMMLADERTPQDYLGEIRAGGRERRWPAAYELSRLMADPNVQAKNPELASALVSAFEHSEGDDPRVRQYLALALGRLHPVPPSAVPALVGALQDADSETRISAILALGSIGDTSIVPTLVNLYQSDDPGVRKVVVYSLGALPGDAQLDTLKTALNDSVADVRWNAALALARHRDNAALPVVRAMLDRESVARSVTRSPRVDAEVDPVGEVMISGLQAAVLLDDASLRERVATISERDESLRVRQAAIETLKSLDN